MTKIKKVIIYNDHPKSVCSFWRGNGPFSELEKQGKIVLTEGYYNETWDTLRRYDIAFFQRPMEDTAWYNVMMCRDMKLKIWIDFDDWKDIYEEHPVYEVFKKQYNETNFREVLRVADVVTFTNEYIMGKYIEFEPSISNKSFVIPNAINDYVYPISGLKPQKYILIRGGSHHDHDLKGYMIDLLNVLKENKDWALISMGTRIRNAALLKNYQYLNNLGIHQYFAFILSLRPAIIAAPLVENEFNKCKSDIAFQEATMAGGVAIMPEWSNHGNAITYSDNFKEILKETMASDIVAKRNESLKYLKKLSVVNDLRTKILETL